MRAKLSRLPKYAILSLVSLAILLPLVAMVFASLKTAKEYATSGPLVPPRDWLNLGNYVVAFTKGNMLLGLANTTFIMVISLTGTILLGTMAAYAIDRFSFRGRRAVLALFLIATLVPGVTTQVATFQIVNNLGLFNSLWAGIILFMGTDIIAIYIFLQFMASIPRSLDEAARLDGANNFTIYLRVILPLLRPAIATVVIIKGIAIYNEFYIPFLYMPSSDLGTVSTSLFRFTGPFGGQWQILSAGAILVVLPSLILFLVLQRFVYRGLTQGAVK